MGRRPTRRELIRGGIIAGSSALAGGGAGGLLSGAGAQAAAAAPDGARDLNHAIRMEQLVVIAYRQVVGSGVILPAVEAQLTAMLDQEVQHVDLLEHALTARGETVPTPPTLPEAQAMLSRHQVPWSLRHLTNQHDCLKLLVDVESLLEYAYFLTLATVVDPGLLETCAQIMGCEAQHWTVLSGLLNHQDAKRAVPYPFVEGTP